MNHGTHISQNAQVCHAVDIMVDTRFCLNVRWRSRLCAARAVHVRHPDIPIHERRRLAKTPSASFCQVDVHGITT